MPTSVAEALFLVAAGALAALVGSAGGITSLISYPALLAVGIPPLQANVSNAVALVASGLGSTFGARPELAGQHDAAGNFSPVRQGQLHGNRRCLLFGCRRIGRLAAGHQDGHQYQ